MQWARFDWHGRPVVLLRANIRGVIETEPDALSIVTDFGIFPVTTPREDVCKILDIPPGGLDAATASKLVVARSAASLPVNGKGLRS